MRKDGKRCVVLSAMKQEMPMVECLCMINVDRFEGVAVMDTNRMGVLWLRGLRLRCCNW